MDRLEREHRVDVGTAGSVIPVPAARISSLPPTWEFFNMCDLQELRRMGAKVEVSPLRKRIVIEKFLNW